VRGYAVRLRARTNLARRLRKNATEVENRLWQALRELRTGHRFRRQHPIGPYVVDFACPARKLAIEADGGQHTFQAEEDAARATELARRGYRVIRFWNTEVIDNLPGVLAKITEELNSLSALKGGEGGDPSLGDGEGEVGARQSSGVRKREHA
jgi:very-short-patch-repair endonuclease